MSGRCPSEARDSHSAYAAVTKDLAAEVLRLRVMVEWLVKEITAQNELRPTQSGDPSGIMTHAEWETWKARAITWEESP